MRYLHTMVRISNIEDSLHFYCEGLGLKEFSRTDYPQGRFTLIFLCAPQDLEKAQINKAPLIELTYNWPNEENQLQEELGFARNFGHLAFCVDDIYKTCEHLMSLGIKILRPPRDGRMAFIKSPDNISIELLQAGDPLPLKSPWTEMNNQGTW